MPETTLIATGAVDCDVHPVVPPLGQLGRYLNEYWREVVALTGFKGPVDSYYPAHSPLAARPEWRRAGAAPGASVAGLTADLFGGAEPPALAILNPLCAVEGVHNPDAAAATASAVNDWLIAEWLAVDPRWRGSIVAPVGQPDMAAREIDRVGGAAGVVQVLLPVRSEAPYGNRRYLPIFEAAARHGLVVGIHYGGAPGGPPSPVGWPSSFLEEYVGAAQIFQSQLMSLICEGVFDRFPDMRVTLIEAGFTWLPSFLWRVDKDWKGIRREVPWVRRLPTEYVHQHVRFTLQPLDAPPTAAAMARLTEHLGSDELLLYSTDYPHWHAGEGNPAAALPEALRRKVMVENPRAWYRLG